MKRLSADRVAAKLHELCGNVSAVGKAFGVTRQAVQKFIRTRPALKAELQEARETMRDNCESVLYRAALAGEAWAVCLFLKTQAKERGYTERYEVVGPDAEPIRHVQEVVVRSRVEARELLAALHDSSEVLDRLQVGDDRHFRDAGPAGD
jgi:hypothetical protein